MERYRHLNTYLKEKFGERTLKIPIDAGFTCPNRDGKVGKGGCIFCSKMGSGEHLKNIEIEDQVKNYFNSYKAKRANKFIVYFQNFTNTYADVLTLKKKYDSSLIDDRIVGLDIATRPDCINEEICKLIASYKEKYEVTVELGLQTASDRTAYLINRGYSLHIFTEAVNMLNKYGIEIVVHIMIGLPNEGRKELKETVDYINQLNIQGIKIHSTYIVKGTSLDKMYNEGKYTPITLDYYLESLEYVLTHINSNIVIHRITGDAPKDLLVAPRWNLHKKWVLNGIEKIMKEKDLYQGMYFM